MQYLLGFGTKTTHLAGKVPVGGYTLAVAAHGEARVGRQPPMGRCLASVGEGATLRTPVLVASLAGSEILQVIQD